MFKTAEMFIRAPEAEKPTVLLMIYRNELEDQMMKNLFMARQTREEWILRLFIGRLGGTTLLR